MYHHRPNRIELKDALVGDNIVIPSRDKLNMIDYTVGGMLTSITRSEVLSSHLIVTLGKGYRGPFDRHHEVKLLPGVLRDEGIAMAVNGSPTFNVTYVRDGDSLYRVTYDWMTDGATRTLVSSIPNDEQLLVSVGKHKSNRESKIKIAMSFPLTQSEVAS